MNTYNITRQTNPVRPTCIYWLWLALCLCDIYTLTHPFALACYGATIEASHPFVHIRLDHHHVCLHLSHSFCLADSLSAIAAAGGGFSFTTPFHRPFSPQDLDISYPYVEKDRISTVVLVIVSLVAPAVIIFLVSMIFVPGPTIRKSTSRSETFRIKLWEWNTGWMGLGMALASAFFLTEGVKNLTGKPRPDLLNRCNPDLGSESLATNAVGGVGKGIFNGLVMVSSTICRQKSRDILDDGFKSFFSGHSSCSYHHCRKQEHER